MNAITFLYLLMTVAACSKSDKRANRDGAGADPKVTVTGFIEAMAVRDLDRAKSYMPGDGLCADQPSSKQSDCRAEMQAQRDGLDSLKDEYPEGATVKAVDLVTDSGMPAGLAAWKVLIVVGGQEQETGALTMEFGGKYYITIARRSDPR